MDLSDIEQPLPLADSHELLFPLPPAENVKLRSKEVCGELVQEMQQEHFIVMDKSRRENVDEIGPIVYDMDRGKLTGLRHCAMIFGPRGIGKTRFLKALMSAARVKFPTVFCCYLNYKTEPHVRPIAFFFRELFRQANRQAPDDEKLPGTIGLAKWLEKHKKCVLFVAHNIDAVYGFPPDEGDPIIRELIAIGQFDELHQKRRLVALVAGSSWTARRLCFAQLAEHERAQYPSYCGLDFNDRKYFILPLTSIQTEEFVQALDFFRGDTAVNDEDKGKEKDGSGAEIEVHDATECKQTEPI